MADQQAGNSQPQQHLSRKPSTSASASQPQQQPLRHGRKPIYPDSDAEAEGLDADLDDEHLETRLGPNANGSDERSSLLSGPGAPRNGKNAAANATAAWTFIDHVRARLPRALSGDPARANRLARRRAQRCNISAAAAGSRRNSRNLSSSNASSSPPPPPSSFAAWRHKHPYVMRALYVFIGLFLAGIFLVAIAVALFFTIPSAPSQEAQSKILDESLLLKGPDRLQLLNISDDGILVRVDARLGLDPDHALDTWLGRKVDMGWLRYQERKVVEWVMGKVAGVQIDIGEVRLGEMGAAWSEDASATNGDPVAPRDFQEGSSFEPLDMLAFHLDPVILPLPPLNRKVPDDADESSKPPILGNHSTPAARHNMHPLNLTVLLKPVSPAEHIMNYVKHALETGKARLDVKVSSLRVRGLGEMELHGVTNSHRHTSWFDVPRRIDVSQRLIRSPVQEKVPKVKNDTDTDGLLKLDDYEFFEIGQDDGGDLADLATRALGIRAKAMARNPLGRVLQGHVGYSLPFGIYLPVDAPPTSVQNSGKSDGDKEGKKNTTDDSVLMAVVATEPFALTGQKKVKLNLEGRVVPPPKDSKPRLQQQQGDADEGYEDSATSQLVFASGPGLIPSSSSDGGLAHIAGGEDTPQQLALSNFLSKFLRGDPNTVYVRGGSPFAKPSDGQNLTAPDAGGSDEAPLPGGGSALPAWVDSALRLVDLPISFPGSKVTDLIKNVTIADLKITPHPFEKDKLLCSGTVLGVMNLPGQLSTVDVKITHLWPDILVFDGMPPSMRTPGGGDGDDDGDDGDDGDGDDDDGDWLKRAASLSSSSISVLKNFVNLGEVFSSSSSSSSSAAGAVHADRKKSASEPVPPLPNPLPAKAFGRVRPHDFSPATTYTDPSDPTGQTKLLRSELKDVPFTVLPGRGDIFRSFTWKLVTGEGALAGIEGSSRAKIWNSGLGTLQLRNLPVKGAFVVGKR